MVRKLIPDVVSNQDLVAVTPETTVREAARHMADRRVGASLVNDAGCLIGIFTERDVMTRVVALGLDPEKTEVRQVMTPNPATATPDQRALDALKTMHEGGFRHLPVVKDGRAVGIVSLRDFLSGEFAEMQAELAQEEALTRGVR
jgi:CBS domain-containing protein